MGSRRLFRFNENRMSAHVGVTHSETAIASNHGHRISAVDRKENVLRHRSVRHRPLDEPQSVYSAAAITQLCSGSDICSWVEYMRKAWYGNWLLGLVV